MIVQIYSLTDPEEARQCALAGADHIGVLVSRSQDSRYPCEVSVEQGKAIFAAVNGLARKVLICVEPEADSVLAMTEELQPDILHLCADYHGDAAFRERLRQVCPQTELMEAVGVKDEGAIADALHKASYSDWLILDTVPDNNPGIGAAGKTHDWSIDRQILAQVQIPVIEAGGLGPENVADAIQAVHPDGVDSMTRTSRIVDGRIVGKDLAAVRAFVKAAKGL